MSLVASESLGDKPELVLDCRNVLGESILWDDRAHVLRWTDIHAATVLSWDPLSGHPASVLPLAERVAAIGLREADGLVLAVASGFAFLDGSGRLERLAKIEADRPTTRLNDGRVDPFGRFVCGGMDEAADQQPISAVYVLDTKHGVTRILDGVHCANSICWSPDGSKMYFSDMPSRRIDVFDYDAGLSELGLRKSFAELPPGPGLPDGSQVDEAGFLWNAEWGGGKVVRYSPAGERDREIALPVSNPTCVAFGGPDLDILFITSASFGLDPAARALEPHAGSVFALRPGVRGRREYRFAA
jgi:L-arabinonolactonase